MADDIYYVGDTIFLSFRVEATAPGIVPVEGKVSVYTVEGEIVHDDPATIVEDVVSYELSDDLTRHSGDYLALFTLTFKPRNITTTITKTHEILFAVLPRGLPQETEETPVTELTPDSSDDDIEDAIGQSLRMLRRMGISEKIAVRAVYDTAQEKLGRRLPK